MESAEKISIESNNTRILNIRHLKLAFGNFDISAHGKQENGVMDFTVTVEQKNALSKKNKGIGVLTNIKFSHPDTNESIIDYSSEIVYEIDYFDTVITKLNGKTEIHKPFLNFIYLISLSTARGLLYEKLSNSPYNKVFLPILELEHLYRER
ncbi:hypothetical protein EXU85_22510 [Spirosoma sp. KCTC 42546]|uniref:hypothetical protein n=1 Tax=Spirosoma sp. KCTC 42546 TaxID=2520506 RepID=UPI00115C0E2F|nr:hypothetical protein [Spirosoma sp. KCTC 42546]QDK81229.1 hypothetical protein EXU85_22510 [Spirosoma sp. KCTC 42546]